MHTTMADILMHVLGVLRSISEANEEIETDFHMKPTFPTLCLTVNSVDGQEVMENSLQLLLLRFYSQVVCDKLLDFNVLSYSSLLFPFI